MSTPHQSRHGRRPLVLAAALAGLALGLSLMAATPGDARDLGEVRRQASHPRKIVKLPTRPSQRAHRAHPDRVKARPGRGHADRVRARPGRYHHHAEPRIRDYRSHRGHGG